MIRTSWQYSLDEELERQAGTMRRLGFTADYLEGVSAFLEKRPPKFTGN
jgi:2-(1,2-epoxy-1,2-dihydrophenyl)acetyl-CoA isomerase